MRKRIAFVIHRYGEGADGGAAAHCRALAEHLAPLYATEVLTSTSRDYPYKAYFPTGSEYLGGVLIKRFALEWESSEERRVRLKKKMLGGDREAQTEWMEENGPYCPELIRYLRDNAKAYQAVFFIGYNHYLTYAGMQLELPNAVLIPLAHDEAMIRTGAAKAVFSHAWAFLFNTVEEKELVERLFGACRGPERITCFGLDLEEPAEELPERYQELSEYIVFAGRVAQNKNFAELNKYFIEYKKRHDTRLKLVVLGKVLDGLRITWHQDIIYQGYVSEEDKKALLHQALCLVLPSRYESLSIVVLESFLQERPVLVNGTCPVLVGQCKRSNAGLYYTNYAEFEAELTYLRKHPEACREMGENGARFVRENYCWAAVLKNFREMIEEVGEGIHG